MKRIALSMLAASMPFCLALTAHADWVRIQGGEVYRGSIVSMDGRQVLLRDDNGIEIRIPRDRVEQIGMGEHAAPREGAPGRSAAAPAPRTSPGAEKQAQEPSSSGLLSMFPQLSQSKPAPSEDYRFVKLAEVFDLPDGARIRLRGRYGRLKTAATGVAQTSLTWYLNDGEHELRISGPVPPGISSYSRDHWGSLIEVWGRLRNGSGGAFVRVEGSRIIRRSQSLAPES